MKKQIKHKVVYSDYVVFLETALAFWVLRHNNLKRSQVKLPRCLLILSYRFSFNPDLLALIKSELFNVGSAFLCKYYNLKSNKDKDMHSFVKNNPH